MENALDAGAKNISIQVAGAGRSYIEVADDGAGIPFEEVELAVARHATSKLREAEDLFRIHSLGFRGEALASVGSVSQMTIITRCPEAETGARLVVNGGQVQPLERVGVPAGTVVQVKDLFFNVPARLKFLKSDLTERGLINNLVARYALAYPFVRFRLVQDGKLVVQTSGNGERREILAQTYGTEIARKLLEVTLNDEDRQVSGFISPVGITRSNRREITFFVNGRWIQDSALTSALLRAYQTLIMVGRYPYAFLFIQLNPEEVDVNVHPAKAEVRFRQPDSVFSLVQRAVRRALMAYSPAPQISAPYWRAYPQPEPETMRLWQDSLPVSAATEQSEQAQTPPVHSQPTQIDPAKPLLLRVIGQIGAAYIVAEGPDGLYLIDQHAAHERVLFEKYSAQAAGSIQTQNLLEAVTVQLSPAAAQILTDQLDLINRLGFRVEEFGLHTFRVRAVPAVFTGIDPAGALRVVVEDFEEDETPLQAALEARLIARICKRAAVKAGQILSLEEQRALVRDLEMCNSPRTCPHGRPTMIHLSVDLLERQFGRRGSL